MAAVDVDIGNNISSKRFEGSAFGSQTARFNLNGIHQNLLTNVKMPYDLKTTSNSFVNIFFLN
jgi:hypothetical protein